jgi:flagellar biogenesis protein FliO
MLVEVENERFLIGATPANINTIAKLSGEAAVGQAHSGKQTESSPQNVPT